MSNIGVLPLCIKPLQLNAYDKYFDDNNKCTNLLVKNKKLLEAYNPIWDKISNLLEKGFDCEPVYDNKYIRTKIKLRNNRINTSFQENTRRRCALAMFYNIIIFCC